jgi:hypothetical protein
VETVHLVIDVVLTVRAVMLKQKGPTTKRPSPVCRYCEKGVYASKLSYKRDYRDKTYYHDICLRESEKPKIPIEDTWRELTKIPGPSPL